MNTQHLHIFTTGGTIDKVYFDALSQFQVGDSPIDEIFKQAGVDFDYAVTSLMRKDSLELTDDDRSLIGTAIKNCLQDRILVTHGTDTMVKSASDLGELSGKTVVFTGAMQPAALRQTDAIFNIGFAVSAALLLPPGAYIAMNGRVLDPATTTKDRDAMVFRDKSKA